MVSLRKYTGKFTFLQYLLIISILIVATITVGTIYDSYNSTSEEYNHNFEILRTNTEQSIIETMKIVDMGLKIYDQSLDAEMKAAFQPFLEAYEDSGGDPSKIDLESLRNSLGEGYDLYIIDANNTIIYSTNKLDLGLDFSSMKDFSSYLDDIRNGDSYKGDRVVKSIRNPDIIHKYAYYPTPDHNYILELSYGIGDNSTREILKYTKTVDELIGMNPYLTSVKMYDIIGDAIGEPEHPDSKLREFIINDIIRAKKDIVIEDSVNGTLTDYRYVNLNRDGKVYDTSIAIAFTYSTAMLDEQILSAWHYDIIATAGFCLLLILILTVFCFKISRPFKKLLEDVNAVAEGDLDHEIRIDGGGYEFVQLEKGISNMVARLRENIIKLRESEEKIKTQNEELEEIVASRTKEARESGDEANFYLDVITHDINNSNMAALGYSELLAETLEEADLKIIKKIILAIQQNAEIIKNISIMRSMKNEDNEIILHSVALDGILTHSASMFPVTTIFEGTDQKVVADSLLEEVFINLIGNCNKYAGTDCIVRISVEESNGYVRTCIEDNGPGIPDNMKDKCFSKYSRNASGGRASGKGLGLYIVKTLVEERYGGKVEALDAVGGHPEEGLKICISLRKA